MIRLRADWVLPITAPPIRDGWVDVADGRVVALGGPEGAGPASREGTQAVPGVPAQVVDLGAVALLPGLVNAHTHLELSYLHGRIGRATRFIDWIRRLMATRREYPDPAADVILDAARRAIDDARAAGTALVGDVSNTLVTVPLLRDGTMPGRVFHEVLGFTVPDPSARVRSSREAIAASRPGAVPVTPAPHAPYSVAPELFTAIRADLDAAADAITTVHLGESQEEVELLRQGTGSWRTFLEELGVWNPGWTVPGTSPVTYLETLGFLDARTLVVHGVQFTGDDIARLRRIGATVVSCPRSNRFVGVGDPPLGALYDAGLPVAFGTDSLASTDDLNLFAELAQARVLAPRVPASALLHSATRIGAAALGFDDHGAIAPGQRAALVTVRVPAGLTDVEEYLVGGVTPDLVGWAPSHAG